MKYFLTLLGVAAFIVAVFAFNGNFIENSWFRSKIKIKGTSIEFKEGAFSLLDKGVKGNGDVIDKTRSLGKFTSVKSSNAIKVELIKGDETKVVVRTDSNLQEHLITEVRGSELKIYVKGSIRRYSEMTVFVTFTDLERLRSSSASDIICKDKIESSKFSVISSSASSIKLDELVADRVEVKSSSASSVKIAGECSFLKVNASSAAEVELYSLEARNGDVKASSAADIEVFVAVNLEARATSGADISYKGKPTNVDFETSSGGDISKQ